MEHTTTVQQAEERAEAIAGRLGYELGFWNRRWHWRKLDWRIGVWYAADYATKLKALDGIVNSMGR